MPRGEIPLEPLPLVRDDEVGHLTLAFIRVLSKLLESRAALEHLAHHDALTGLPNRQLLADRMKQALARAQRGQRLVAVCSFISTDSSPLMTAWARSGDVSGQRGGARAIPLV